MKQRAQRTNVSLNSSGWNQCTCPQHLLYKHIDEATGWLLSVDFQSKSISPPASSGATGAATLSALGGFYMGSPWDAWLWRTVEVLSCSWWEVGVVWIFFQTISIKVAGESPSCDQLQFLCPVQSGLWQPTVRMIHFCSSTLSTHSVWGPVYVALSWLSNNS